MFQRLALALATGLGLSSMAHAQNFDARFQVTGAIGAIVEGTSLQFYTTIDSAKNRSSITRHEVLGKVFFNITGRSDTGQGEPKSPTLSIQIGPGDFPPKTISDITLLIDGMILMADPAGGGSASISNVDYGADGSLSFGFEGVLVEIKRTSDGNLLPVEGGAKRKIRGSFAGVIPGE